MRLELDFAGQEIDLVDAKYVVEWRVAGLALSMLRELLVLNFVVDVAFVVVEALMEDWTSSCCGKMSSNVYFLKVVGLKIPSLVRDCRMVSYTALRTPLLYPALRCIGKHWSLLTDRTWDICELIGIGLELTSRSARLLTGQRVIALLRPVEGGFP